MTLKSELTQLWADYLRAYQAGDAEGCAKLFEAQARLMSPYGPIATSRSAIADLHREWTKDGAADKTLDLIDFGGEGNIAWCYCHFSEADGAEQGVSLSILARNRQGEWRIKLCSLNDME